MKRQTVLLVLAFAAVYLIWGTTYLAVHVAVQTLPPFAMSAIRLLVAGALLLTIQARRQGLTISKRQWAHAFGLGALFFAVPHSAIAWAELTVPTGVVAMIVATVPLWMTLSSWVWTRSDRPRLATVGGLALGLVGTGLLVAKNGATVISLWGCLAVLLGTLTWSAASILAPRLALPKNAGTSSGMMMIGASGWLVLASLLSGELHGFSFVAVSGHSLMALLYLTLFGSMVGFGAYTYLLRRVSPARAATYAFVNPVIAVSLGWWVNGERLGLSEFWGMGLIVLAVILVIWPRNFFKRVALPFGTRCNLGAAETSP